MVGQAEVGRGEVPERPVDFTVDQRSHVFGRDRARGRERRTFAVVEPAFELAVGALEVVFVETALIADATPPLVDLVDVVGDRLVTVVIRPAAPR